MELSEKAYTISWTYHVEEGITPLPEKLISIQKMLCFKTPKEIKQFLGLIA